LDAEETLGKVKLFEGLRPKQIKTLAKWATRRHFQQDQAIVTQGQLGVGLYCIESGRVSVAIDTPSGPLELRKMGVGEAFGELALLDDKPRSATVTAVEPTTTLILDKAQFLAELRTYPEIGLALLPVLTQWIRDADEKLAELL
jgi:CRP/FNR family transcriptional regulator, cyclic AMP receptor protein